MIFSQAKPKLSLSQNIKTNYVSIGVFLIASELLPQEDNVMQKLWSLSHLSFYVLFHAAMKQGKDIRWLTATWPSSVGQNGAGLHSWREQLGQGATHQPRNVKCFSSQRDLIRLFKPHSAIKCGSVLYLCTLFIRCDLMMLICWEEDY